MEIRRRTEGLEQSQLSPFAALSISSRGRDREELPCLVRTVYQRDRDRIIHSKSFRRLKHKTQVFIAPTGDHYRTRLTHTLEVAQIARTIAKALLLNEDLTEAIALGHDLGHTPFGHAGEEALNEIYSGGFKHNEQSQRVVEVLEGGKGLNLTWEVRDGIRNHTGPVDPVTLEGQIVKIADRIAYINHDIDDALRAGIIRTEELPPNAVELLGKTQGTRINCMVQDMIQASWEQPQITMSAAVRIATNELRKFLFERVYIGSKAKKEEYKAREALKAVFSYYKHAPVELPTELFNYSKEVGVDRVVCDYVAGMTDRFAVAAYARLFVPQGFPLVALEE
jgi:dGTPase